MKFLKNYDAKYPQGGVEKIIGSTKKSFKKQVLFGHLARFSE